MHYFKIIQILFQIIAKNSSSFRGLIFTRQVIVYTTPLRVKIPRVCPLSLQQSPPRIHQGSKAVLNPIVSLLCTQHKVSPSEGKFKFVFKSRDTSFPRKIIAKWRKYIDDIFQKCAPPMAIPEILVPSNIYSGLKKSFLIRYM